MRELSSSRPRNRVELCAPLCVRDAPFRRDPATLLQADESGIDRPLVEQDGITTSLLNATCETIAVLRSHGREGLKDHEIERPLQQVQFRTTHRLPLSIAD